MKKSIISLSFCAILAAFGAAGVAPHYHPDGNSAVTVNGTARFNRGLYGAHTGFRVDCSDMPEFGIYLPRMGGNLRFTLPEGNITARYTPGKMTYLGGGVDIEAQVMRSYNVALWSLTNTTDRPISIPVRFGGVAEKKFSREGDLGVDKPDCFDLKKEYCAGNVYSVRDTLVTVEYGVKERKSVNLLIPATQKSVNDMPAFEGVIELQPGATEYVAFFPAETSPATYAELPALMRQAEVEREELASTFSFTTPDEYLNPIAGALSVAADGIWSGEAWLHGSIGWRTPHLGWRGAYVGDAIGWHDRALTHFRTYAANQVTDIPQIFNHPCQDSILNLARAEKRWGTPMYSNGYICRRPGKMEEMSHYDMNIVYIDAMLRHFRHTGDTAVMRELFPVVKLHLDWEKRNFDPDNNHLYDAYCCIWASDALYYTGGDVTHSSAYNYFANLLAAEVAEAIGEDGSAYRDEAAAIKSAIHSALWLPERGHWAEYRDLMGHKRVHPSAAVWTIYHAIDSEIADELEAYAATTYVDREIPHIPVGDTGYSTISTTNWKPYSWSINNVAIAEVMHTALVYWQAGRPDEACRLMKGVVMDNMYYGASPLNFGQISQYDAARGECYRDFADPIGVWSRALTEGLFGIRPDMIGSEKVLTIRPGFPPDWNSASVSLPNVEYKFNRDGSTTRYDIANRYGNGSSVRLIVPVKGSVGTVTVNGKQAQWKAYPQSIEQPWIVVDAGTEPQVVVEISADSELAGTPTGNVRREGPVEFTEMADGALLWWAVEQHPVAPICEIATNGFDDIAGDRCKPIDISESFNASVNDIFRNEYLSPRPAVTTLQLPKQGIGEWCHPKDSANIDDSGLRRIAAQNKGIISTELGIDFATPAEGNNVVYTSLWDNYPDSVTIPLKGKGSHLYLLMAGSTNHMQAYIPNGEIRVEYTDGSSESVSLVNPYNWAPIEQDFFTDDHAFALPEGVLPPYRMMLSNGRIGRSLENIGAFLPAQGDEKGLLSADGRRVDGGAATMLDIPINPSKKLRSLSLETLSNDVVIGIMAITLQK